MVGYEGLEPYNNNRNRIFRYIYNATQPVTKQDVVAALRLSLPTVTVNLNRLMEEGLLRYGRTIASTGGRKPRTIEVMERARVAIGISIREKSIIMVSIDLRVGEVSYQKTPLPFEDHGEYYQTLVRLLELFIRENELKNILGVGITLPGIIIQEEDMVEFAPRLRLRKKKLAEIRGLFPYKVFFMNDANARGYVEWWNHPEHGTIAYLSVDQGVGGSIIMGGVPYLGDNGRSAEFGHICIQSGGRRCSCGQKGCLEAYCSVSRLAGEPDGSLEDFFAALEAGEPQHQEIWKEYLAHLAQGIVNIRATLDCEVVLGGALSLYMEGYMRELHQRVAALSPFEDSAAFLRLSKYRTRSSGVGAALHYVNEFLQEL